MRKNFWLNFLGNILLGILVFSIYNLTIMFVLSFENAPSHTLISIIILELVIIVAGTLVFFAIRYLFNRKCKQDKLRFEQEKLVHQWDSSTRLIETLASVHREFRNRLQVMNMFAAMGKTGELSNYILSIATKLSESKMMEITNPIIVAAIIPQKIRGMERGIETVIYSDTPFNDFAVDLVKLGETLDLVLGLFIENEVLSKSITKTVIMDIKNDNGHYCFQFKNSEEAARNFRTGKYRDYKLPLALEYREEGVEEFKMADTLIKNLGGKPEYIVKGGYVVQLNFKLKKQLGKN